MTKTWPRGRGSEETGTQTHTEGTSTLCVFPTPRELPGDVESWLSQWHGDGALPARPAWLGERCRVASRKKSLLGSAFQVKTQQREGKCRAPSLYPGDLWLPGTHP